MPNSLSIFNCFMLHPNDHMHIDGLETINEFAKQLKLRQFCIMHENETNAMQPFPSSVKSKLDRSDITGAGVVTQGLPCDFPKHFCGNSSFVTWQNEMSDVPAEKGTMVQTAKKCRQTCLPLDIPKHLAAVSAASEDLESLLSSAVALWAAHR